MFFFQESCKMSCKSCIQLKNLAILNLGPKSCKIAIKCKKLARIFKDLRLTLLYGSSVKLTQMKSSVYKHSLKLRVVGKQTQKTV